MDYLQYLEKLGEFDVKDLNMGFKPYYKWITFNTKVVLKKIKKIIDNRFKPYYKWITFNTPSDRFRCPLFIAISFKPYYKWITFNTENRNNFDIISQWSMF